MTRAKFTILRNRGLAPGVFELTLTGDASCVGFPGQFVEIAIPGHFLRRPVSICDWTAGSIVLLVRTVGAGTAWLESAAQGEEIDVILPLGNGFDVGAPPHDARVILVGGGIGVAPLFALARALAASGRDFTAVLGYRNAGDVFYADRFSDLGCETIVATEDGSAGVHGFVTDAIATLGEGRRYLFACGPMPMLRALSGLPRLAGGQFSLEARMGCGFGACMGCTVKTASGPARVCREGPVFHIEDLIWK